MADFADNEAAKPNPALEPLSVVVGTWSTDRRHETTFQDNVWKWSRKDPEFSQRSAITIARDGRTMVSRGEFSRNGAAWEPDLELTFTRVD